MDKELLDRLNNWLEYCETDRQENWQEIFNNPHYDETEDQVRERFDPKTCYEACDRAIIFSNNWNEYVLNHPSILMNEKLHKCAYLAHNLMMHVYNELACAEDADDLQADDLQAIADAEKSSRNQVNYE